MHVEPAADQRLAEGIGVRLLQRRFENFFPAAKPAEGGFDDFAGQTNRLVALLPRKSWELVPIFVTTRKVGQQILRCCDAEPPKRQDFRARNPIERFEFCGDVDHAAEKHQAPSTKHQGNSKLQSPRRARSDCLEAWLLVLPWGLVIGVWCFKSVPPPVPLPTEFPNGFRLRTDPVECEKQCPTAAAATD